MGINEKKEKNKKFSFGIIFIVSLICSALFFVILALFSFFALKNGITQSAYMPAGLSAGALSAFIGGFVLVRPVKSKGILYGAVTGLIQSLLCSVVLFLSNRASAGVGIFILSGIIIIFASIGGITAVNLKFKKKY